MTDLAHIRNFSMVTHIDHSKSKLTNQLIKLSWTVIERERAVHLPARREDTFKRAAREEDIGRQSALDL